MDVLNDLLQIPATTTQPLNPSGTLPPTWCSEWQDAPDTDPATLARDLVPTLRRWPLSHPLMLRYIPGAYQPTNALAGAICADTNPNLAGRAGGPVAHAHEKATLARLLNLIGWPTGSGIFCTGGSQGNWLGLQVGTGSTGAPIRFLVPDTTHFSIHRAARLTAPTAPVVEVPTDRYGKLDLAALGTKLSDGPADAVNIICCTAGTSTNGYLDDIPGVRDVCRAIGRNTHIHTDASYGGSYLFSSISADIQELLTASDSVVIDFHKVLGAPYGTAVFLVKDGLDLARTFSPSRSPVSEEFWALGPEESRPWRALALDLILRAHGLTKIQAQLDHTLHLASACAQALRHAGIPCETNLATVVTTKPMTAAAVDRVVLDLETSGVALTSRATTATGQPGLRMCFASGATQQKHLDHLTAVLARMMP